MLVGGWYDTEDPQGLLRQHEFMEKNGPPAVDMLVMGPWNHGGFARGDGDKLGNVKFGSKTAVYYRERIELPFFLYYLKGRGDGVFPKAYVFQTGMNQWRKFDALAARSRQTHYHLSGCKRCTRLAAACADGVRRVPLRPELSPCPISALSPLAC